jgi:probable HAF family extracellular repeat protein
MRLASAFRRAVSPASRKSFSRRTPLRLAAALTAVLSLACQGDAPTDPSAGGRPAPSEPLLELTGAVGTPIFPTVTPGERQPRGDARGLNASGQVTGGAFGLPLDQSGSSEPYRWTPGGTAVRITGCCDSKVGNDINDAGTVVGNAQKDAISGARAFVATGTTIVHLPLLPGGDPEWHSWAVAINNAGQIAGSSPFTRPSSAEHAVLWSPSLVPQDLGTLGGTNSYSIDVNASGQVIGWSQLAGDASSSFFLWSSGTGMVDLRTIDPAITDVVEINDAGQIIGTYVAPNGESHAFLYTPGSGLLDLGTLGGTSSAPTGLNNRGDVVGMSTLADGTSHAFLWTADDGMEDITALAGVPNARRLNDNYQTLVGANRAARGFNVPFNGRPSLVQLQVTQNNAPPTALFTIECNGLTCVLDATESLDDKPGLTFAWDVNKYPGPFASGDKVTVTYPHASQRTITLTVTDANGLTSSLSKTITVSDFPIAAFTYACTGLTCSFDSGGSANDGNPITNRIWYFGDGQTNGSNVAAPSHSYAQPGTYTVKLEVWGSNISERGIVSQQITVTADPAPNQAPVASFTYSCSGFVCSFDATGSTDDKGVVSYEWSLGKAPDGTASGPTVTTDYWHASTRTVTLTVADAEGLSNSVTRTIDVGATQPPPPDAPPVARFTSSCNGTICTLDASTSSDDVGITSYDWSLGKAPGGSATGVSVTTDYWHTSTRTVTLTVTDTKGQTNSVTQTVTVP